MYYAVAVGRQIGIYDSAEESFDQVDGYRNGRRRKFDYLPDAEDYIREYRETPGCIHRGPCSLRDTSNAPIKVFTDGSCKNNGKLYAKAAYSVIFPDYSRFDEAEMLEDGPPVVTNNRAEYMGVIRAMELANCMNPGRNRALFIYTDSKLLINTVTDWMFTWRDRDWKTSSRKPVQNLDLVLTLYDLYNDENRDIRFNYVPAHTRNNEWEFYWNNICDFRAKQCIRDNS
jgi:ribonuclease HI